MRCAEALKRSATSRALRVERLTIRRARVADLPPQLKPRAFQFDHAGPITPVTFVGARIIGRLPLIWINVHFCSSRDRPPTSGDLLAGSAGPKRKVSQKKSARTVNNSRGQGVAGTACEILGFVGIAFRKPPPQICVLPAFRARHTMVNPKH
jgi:hypothetical protein